MAADGTHTQDPDAIRDVANHDMASIVDEISQARGDFLVMFSDNQAFHDGSSWFPDSSPFWSLGSKWLGAGEAISRGMEASQERIEDAAAALRRTADEYEDADTQARADFDGLASA
ncbi:hypothetical protein AB0A73_04985 [Glycomyces sp. NPDC047369]